LSKGEGKKERENPHNFQIGLTLLENRGNLPLIIGVNLMGHGIHVRQKPEKKYQRISPLKKKKKKEMKKKK